MARTTKPRVAVIGLGFVGVTTALGFARKGFAVSGYDASVRVRRRLRNGRLLFHEPHLPEQLRALSGKRFFICDKLADAVSDADVIFYCVGTPQRDDGSADLSFLHSAVTDTLKALPPRRRPVLVIKSTVPPGTAARHILPWLTRAGRKVGRDIGLASNPEFLREGVAWEDFMRPDRVVIGASDARSFRTVARLYAPFQTRVLPVSLGTAEFIKSVSNALLATLVSFSNETALIAEKIGGVDVKDAFQALHLDRRWSGKPARMTSYLYPGCGFGGYCLPKDIAALRQAAVAAGVKPEVLRGVIAANEAAAAHFARKIASHTTPRSRIGILGLAFKPGSDDVRDTPAARVIELLRKRGRKRITAFDPMANESYRRAYGHPIHYARTLDELIAKSDAVALVTAWPEFRRAKSKLMKKKFFDGRYYL